MEEFIYDIGEIDNALIHFLPAKEGLQKIVYEAMDEAVRSGGKRVRPMIIYESYQLFQGGKGRMEEIAPMALADDHFLNFSILKMNHIKSGKTMCFSKDFLIRNMIEFYLQKTDPKALSDYLKKAGLKGKYATLLKKWFTESTDTEIVAAVSTSLKELKETHSPDVLKGKPKDY